MGVELPIEYYWEKYIDFLSTSKDSKITSYQIMKSPLLSWSLEKNFKKWIEANGGDLTSTNWKSIYFKDEKQAMLFCLKWC